MMLLAIFLVVGAIPLGIFSCWIISRNRNSTSHDVLGILTGIALTTLLFIVGKKTESLAMRTEMQEQLDARIVEFNVLDQSIQKATAEHRTVEYINVTRYNRGETAVTIKNLTPAVITNVGGSWYEPSVQAFPGQRYTDPKFVGDNIEIKPPLQPNSSITINRTGQSRFSVSNAETIDHSEILSSTELFKLTRIRDEIAELKRKIDSLR